MKKNNVVLIGFMGSGKSTTGIQLSYRLRRSVEDTDKLIEKKEGRSIVEIFASEGEAYFRELETLMLKYVYETRENQIIAVGGGTPVKEENRKWLKLLGSVVYLRIRPETVYQRLKDDKTRPLLQGEDPQGKICTLLEARRDAYESCADLVVDVDDKTMDQVIDIIQEYLEKGGSER